MRILLLALVALCALPAEAQSFSCPIGKQASCLDYSDKVCSSFSKCVDQNAACFRESQCDYRGFACKSDVVKCANQYKELEQDYNALVNDYNEQVRLVRTLTDELDDVEACLLFASSLSDAQLCSP
jgi:hypothetical protein